MRRIGIDIEEVARWREPRRLELLFSPDELAWASAQPDDAVAYAQLWCAKEAAFKAVSTEFDGSLRQVTVSFSDSGASVHLEGRDDVAARVELTWSATPDVVTAWAVLADERCGSLDATKGADD